MGRTVLPFTQELYREEESWKGYRRALRREDRWPPPATVACTVGTLGSRGIPLRYASSTPPHRLGSPVAGGAAEGRGVRAELLGGGTPPHHPRAQERPPVRRLAG